MVYRQSRAWKDAWKREKIENIVLLLDGAIKAYNRVGLMLNVRREDLDKRSCRAARAAKSHHRGN